MRTTWKKFARAGSIGESGAAAVEMAIVFPLFLIVVLGVLVFGLYIGATHSTQQLAADAARVSVAGLTLDERVSLANSYVGTNAARYVLIFPENLKVNAGPSTSNPDDFVVTVTYDASSLSIWGFSALVPTPS